MQCQELVDIVQDQLNDPDGRVWSTSDLVDYLNAGIRQILIHRPDEYTEYEVIALVSGTKQSLPADARRLLDVVRNMGTDQSTPGTRVQMVSKQSLDLFKRDWHVSNTSTWQEEVWNAVYDEREPDKFWVSPPSDGNGSLEILVSKIPDPITETTLTVDFPLNDTYANPVMEWMMYLAHNKEYDSQASAQEALQHMQTFARMLGLKFGVDIAFSPSQEVANAQNPSA